MKKSTLLLFWALCCGISAAVAQDLIVRTDSTRIEARVTEVSPETVRYKRFSNPDGPTYVLPVAGIDYIHIPMMDQLNSNGFQGLLPASMFDVYRDLLDEEPEDFKTLLEAADARADGCTLFHCRAGKDRTGVVAMLLLALLKKPIKEGR